MDRIMTMDKTIMLFHYEVVDIINEMIYSDNFHNPTLEELKQRLA
jgi:hypothetical protein